ncbi:MAG: Dabb family protein [Clostridia bacterium]|nr:Dabb family protein [Clostridia bacterium]
MIRHIVMWKYKAELSVEERNELFEKLRESADGMNGKIKGLISAKLIKNVNPAEKYDLCLYCEFETLEDINAYQDAPIHLAFKDIITGNVFERACIDAM